jgi:hypothetical protein
MVFGQDRAFDARHDRDLQRARELLERREPGRRETFLATWTEVLAAHHVTRGDVVEIVLDLAKGKKVSVTPPPKRSISDEAQLSWS